MTDRFISSIAGMSRRRMLQLGSLGLAGCGLSLPRLLAAEAECASVRHPSLGG